MQALLVFMEMECLHCLRAHLLQTEAKAFQHAGGYALALT